MNLGTRESVALARGVMRSLRGKESTPNVIIFPPFTVLNEVRKAMARSRMKLGAQNCGTHEKGAYTGEVSVSMLEDVGCEYVLVGHSERRHVFGETNEIIKDRYQMALSSKLTPVLCVGEPAEVRDQGDAEGYVFEQISSCLKDIDISKGELFIAYEPVWAIGSDHAALISDMIQMHAFIKETAAKILDISKDQVNVLYGGSVDSENAYAFLREELVSGVLVGGASIKIKEFQGIMKAASDVISAQEL